MLQPTLSEVTAVLARTPGTLKALLEGLPAPWVDANEGPDTFSPRDVLGHLIYCEKTDWVPRIKLILETGEAKPFVPFDRFGFRGGIDSTSTSALLEELGSLRASNLAFLNGLSLSPTQLSQKGTHPEFGPVTLGQLLATWAVHDLNHIGQVVRVMSKRYAETVGPWKAYLGILRH
jgi:DinB superfamily